MQYNLDESIEEREQILESIEWVKKDIATALEGYKSDPSWIRPMRLSIAERKDIYEQCKFRLDATLALLGKMSDLQRAFVQGAKWWEWQKTNATMWQSDQNLAAEEAIRRYSKTGT